MILKMLIKFRYFIWLYIMHVWISTVDLMIITWSFQWYSEISCFILHILCGEYKIPTIQVFLPLLNFCLSYLFWDQLLKYEDGEQIYFKFMLNFIHLCIHKFNYHIKWTVSMTTKVVSSNLAQARRNQYKLCDKVCQWLVAGYISKHWIEGCWMTRHLCPVYFLIISSLYELKKIPSLKWHCKQILGFLFVLL